MYKMISILGNGVDLFFVISGFCLFLVLHEKPVNRQTYFSFLRKRWWRIAPAFYIAAVVMLGCSGELLSGTGVYKLLSNFLFLHDLLPGTGISYPFWSLAVEFHFYILLPLFLLLSRKTGTVAALTYVFGCGLLLNMIFIGDDWRYTLVTKICHFSIGIYIAYLYVHRIELPSFLSKRTGFFLALALSFAGRTLMSRSFTGQPDPGGRLAIAFGPVIMTMGFGWMILNSISYPPIGKVFANKLFLFYGRISYSFYLWHAFILGYAGVWLHPYLQYGKYDPLILFVVTLIIVTPLSYLSWFLLERLYFNKKKNEAISYSDKSSYPV